MLVLTLVSSFGISRSRYYFKELPSRDNTQNPRQIGAVDLDAKLSSACVLPGPPSEDGSIKTGNVSGHTETKLVSESDSLD